MIVVSLPCLLISTSRLLALAKMPLFGIVRLTIRADKIADDISHFVQIGYELVAMHIVPMI